MAARLPSDLLKRSAEEGARLVALTYLDEISRSERRLADPADSEALHDFRVGLRRLRSCIKTYRGPLKGSVSKKVRRQLRDLTVETNAGRDAEVQLAWLRGRVGQLGAGDAEGLAWLIGRLEGRQYEVNLRVTSELGRRFEGVAVKLRSRLETVRIVIRTGHRQVRSTFGQVTGELICSQVEQLSEKLKAVRGAEEMTEAHEARIAGKRLRYLMEPLLRRVPSVKSLVSRLKRLQDNLGDLHDTQVLTQEVAASLATLEGLVPPPRVLPGLRLLRGLAQESSDASLSAFRTNWSAGKAARFLSRADEVGRALQQSDTSPAARLGSQPLVGNNGPASRHSGSRVLSVG
jgi:CHAD domain-containing protein